MTRQGGSARSELRFAQELKVAEFAPREVLAGKDARTLARELLAMTQKEFSAAFKNSPMKRAKLRRLKRNAAVDTLLNDCRDCSRDRRDYCRAAPSFAGRR